MCILRNFYKMKNNNQHKCYQWYLQFDEITWQVAYGDECHSFVNEENKEVWKEIEDTECYEDYGMPRKNIDF